MLSSACSIYLLFSPVLCAHVFHVHVLCVHVLCTPVLFSPTLCGQVLCAPVFCAPVAVSSSAVPSVMPSDLARPVYFLTWDISSAGVSYLIKGDKTKTSP